MPTMRLRSALLVAAASLGLSFPAFAVDSANTATADAAGPATAGTAASNESPELQEIVVTGMRASLEKSLQIKKDASVVLDSINSEELGKFPDADVADSLEHLPGITISRTTGGEGIYVNVRGLGPQYNITTLNNRILATDDDGRDLAFDLLPSEVISGADVLKSTQASALEGSIGGTVNLRTASPFDNPGFHGGVHAEGNDNDMSDLKGYKASVFASNTLVDNTLGFLIGGVYSDTKTRTDSLNAYNQNIYGPPTYPFNGGPPGIPVTVSPCCITFGSIFDDKKREALSGSLEWRPNEDFKLVADGLWTHLNDPQIGYNESYYFPWGQDQNGNSEWTNGVVKNGLVTSLTANDFQPEMVNNTMNRVVTTTMFGLNASWKPTDRWTITGDLYQSVANRPEGGQDSFVTAGLVNNGPYPIDTLNFADVPNSLPNLNVVIPPSQFGWPSCPKGTASTTNPGECSYTALMNKGILNNNDYWATHYDGLNGYSVHDRVTGFTLDGAYEVGTSVFNKILFGAGYTDRDKTRDDVSNDWTNGSGQYGTLYQTEGCPSQCLPYSFGSQGFNVISMVNIPNFMQGAGGSYPVVLPELNVAQLINYMKSLNGKPNPLYCQGTGTACCPPQANGAPGGVSCLPVFNFAETLPQENPYNSYGVTEQTFSAYGELTFAGERWNANAGVRVVHTETTAATATGVPTSLWTSNAVSSTQTWIVTYPSTTPSDTKGDYTIPLPAVNFNYWAIPERLQLRAAAAETMSRPELSELAPTSTNNAENGQPQLYYNGTAGLKPIKATQVDFSAEWYYHPHSALTLALFGKKIRDDIYTGTQTSANLGTTECTGGTIQAPKTCAPFLWTVYAPANGYVSDYYGIELSWQHILDNGFGAHAQYTHTWNKSYDQNGNSIPPINAVPPETLSAGLFYDKGGHFSADVNWDYAASFQSYCSQCTEVPNWPAISSPFQWVTASAHYKIYKELQIYVEGKNLTNSVARTYLNGNPLLAWAPGQNVGQSTSGVGYGYSSYGRTFTLGASYQF